MKRLCVILGLFGMVSLVGCTMSLQGKPLFGLDPNGSLMYKHPEVLDTNQVIVPHL